MKIYMMLTAAAVAYAPAMAAAQTGACPKYQDVPLERQKQAQELTDRAFAQHRSLNYDRAAELYSEALEYWDRPDIHRHAGMAYFYAAKLFKAHHHLTEALRCGRELLSPERYEGARILMQRLQPWFGEIEVQSQVSGAQVLFDGEPWFAGAETRRRIVLAGQHVIVVKKPGHITVEKLVFVSPLERSVVEPRLLPVAQAKVVSRRWNRWQPWAVVGAGAVIGVIGAGLEWRASVQFNEYAGQLLALCADMDGCRTDEQAGLLATWNAATLKNRLAVGSFIAGGALVAAGLTLVVLNQPRTSKHPDAGRAGVRVVPMVSSDSAGMSLGITF